MEERLKRLKNSMNQSVFKDVIFSEEQRSTIIKKIQHKKNPELDVLQLLQSKKTGFEISRALLSRGISNFANNEGMLYVLLHKLEAKELIVSEWIDTQKFYQLTSKGSKQLKKFEEKTRSLSSFLRELTEGGL
jgi:DNA-binding PadR family transcriptional regulator